MTEFIASAATGKTESENQLVVVGIGASAGGIKALKEFFEHVPADSGLAYVVILHLSPDHDSQLAAVLQTSALIPVLQVNEKVLLEANTVYVISPNKSLLMEDGHLSVASIHTIEERRAPVDIFFRTLAESRNSRAICVVLSGTGANGSMGMKRVKEHGGAAFVQSPREAEFSEMPRNSIATDLVDAILPVAQIPKRIIEYVNSSRSLTLVSVPVSDKSTQQQALRDILTRLRVKTGHDFINYKRATVLRRIERRINVHNLPDLGAYSLLIKEHPEETTALLKDLLISVTNFFRDKKAFQYLEKEIIPQILAQKENTRPIRAWVAGCATGEEAYSLAMLFAEKIEHQTNPVMVQIFATDIDETAITTAREGYYSSTDAADVSPERLRRFFSKEGDGYRIKRDIREMVLFANHNMIKDAPFSKLDLITCRNMLIYFNSMAQKRVTETFHFALNPGGHLFLGSSESLDSSGDLYVVVNKEYRIYQSRQVSGRAYPVPESLPPSKSPVQKSMIGTRESETRALERITYSDLHQQLLERYAPPSILVNEEYDIVHLSATVGRYLLVSGGELTKNLLKLIRPELRIELRTALYQAVQRQVNIESKNHQLLIDNQLENINILVRPVLEQKDTARGFILILFEIASKEDPDETDAFLPAEPAARQLEEELIRMKLHLRNSVEQYEVQTEELKASNEELQAINEELRSSSEELETSKEELQSVNEELITVNQELKVKVDELSQSNNNFQNLIYSTDIATIFLDRNFRVNDFTPAAREIFNLLPADFGRPLSNITHRLDYTDLMSDIESVLEKLVAVKREVRSFDNKYFVLKILPYRTSEDRINGVVINFFDITEQRLSAEKVKESEVKYRDLFNSIDEGFAIIEIFTNDLGQPLDGKFLEVNSSFANQSGLRSASGKTFRELVPDLGDIWFNVFGEVAATGMPKRFEEFEPAMQNRWLEVYAYPYGAKENNHLAVIFGDITKRKKDELNLKTISSDLLDKQYKLEVAQRAARVSIWDYNFGTQQGISTPEWEELTGYTSDGPFWKLEKFLLLLHADDRSPLIKALEHSLSKQNGLEVEFRIDHPVRGIQYMLMRGSYIRSFENADDTIIGSLIDITDRKALEQLKDDFIGITSHELKTPLTSIKMYAEVLLDIFRQSGDSKNAALLVKLDAQVDRLTNLVRDLLDVTRISEGKLQIERELTDVNELINTTINDFRMISTNHSLVVVAGKIRQVSIDRERISQVLINLVANAIKYSPEKSEIMISTSEVAGGLRVAVADKGIGIPAVSIQKVFDRFYRGTQPNVNTYPGLGLGLYICAEIIRRHGGTIQVNSKENGGSEFYFMLPYDKNL
ncbi:MAG: CheR family methyltransferase [Chitinophagaceae bacterium]